MARLILFTFLVAIGLGAQDTESIRRLLMEKDREFAAEAERRGVDGFADWLAEKDILKFEGLGQPPLTTREAVRAAMKKQLGTNPFLLRWEPLKADAAQSGEIGYTFGKWTVKGKDREGKAVTREGHYVSIWKKQSDGSWKVVVDLGS